MNQEQNYLKALQSAERFERIEPFLYIYCRDQPRPLKFIGQDPPRR